MHAVQGGRESHLTRGVGPRHSSAAKKTRRSSVSAWLAISHMLLLWDDIIQKYKYRSDDNIIASRIAISYLHTDTRESVLQYYIRAGGEFFF